ncbi:hypothetical protein ABEB36_014408 [Hypothenemus hampei]|uniref:Uncharacterized protein n=1 Tax=Hypothenemus hampei TaxID=57062 RepID=A0ABD1E1Q6_HYPHA
MNGLHDLFVASLFEDIKSIIRERPFIPLETLAFEFLNREGCLFEEYGLGPLEVVLARIPDIVYVEDIGYYIPLPEVGESPYAVDQEASEYYIPDYLGVVEGEEREDVEIEVPQEAIEAVDSGCEDDTDMETDVDDIFVNDMEWNGEWDMCPDHPGVVIVTPIASFNNSQAEYSFYFSISL